MSVKIKDIKTKVIREDDGSYSIACSALCVYSTGANLQDAKKLSKSGQTSFVSIEEKSYRINCDLKRLSPNQGKELIKILCNKFSLSNKTKSHVTITNGTIYVTVPLKEIHIVLLGVILRDCSITREKFSKEVLMNSEIFQSE